MFKLKNLSVFAAVLFLGLSSCSKDNDDTQEVAAPVEGTWQFTKEGTITNNQEIINDYQHTTGCTKDYLEIFPANIIKDHYFDNPNCQETIDTGAWTRNNNALTFVYQNGTTVNAEIMQLTNTTLKLKFVLSGNTNLVVLTRL
ncbi:lipocalin family protein [Flavobacterium sp. WV_118_3]|uniref:lipocalin family protein n=1 Tax=Flavobacterium sp. WV_118_3 TaxID=3151764 RepID=UPI002BB9A2FA|nr:lipocalin family protein [Flavobacterium sp.]